MKRLLLITLMQIVGVASILGQDFAIKGIVKDATGVTLPGADVVISGTKNGTSTNFDGEFELSSKNQTGELVVSYIGYISETVTFDASKKAAIVITLKENALNLNEVELFASRAIDRKTPIAVSTIKKEEIVQKLGNQEFVEVFKSTPGVFASQQRGGFGESEILIRGFQSANVAVVINGIPVNDTEDGRVFWSNWGGIGNVTSSTQTQRGLGASKVAVPSIGGTINIITETTDAQKGGEFIYGLGNDGYTKYGLKLSTGLMDNGWAATVYADRRFGDGYVDGTLFDAFTYFGSITKRINDNHKLSFFATGAPQRHGGRFERMGIQTFRNSERGIRLNKDWGIKNGEVFSLSENFFHKPLMSLNHYWTINDSNKLSTAIYYTSGKGGVTFENTLNGSDLDSYRIGNQGPVDLDAIVRDNQANGESNFFLETRTNDHTWWGGLSTLKTQLGDQLELTSGLDIRYSITEKARVLEDLLGGEFIDISGNNLLLGSVNTSTQRTRGQAFQFDKKNFIRVGGAFAQLEYDEDNLSAFVAGNAAYTSSKRQDFYHRNGEKTDWVDFFTFGGKAGLNYRFNTKQNIFFNGGYFERAPFFETIFLRDDFEDGNDVINEDAENQKIFSLELGYGLRLDKLAMNINIYRTEWLDRSETRTASVQGLRVPVNILGIDALHQGVEMDFEYRPFKNLTLTGMISVGDWKWQDDVNATITVDGLATPIETNIKIKNTPVGRAAQTTSALGLKYSPIESTTLFIDYNYYDRLYADYNPVRRTENIDPYQVPDYSLFDASFEYKFKIAGLKSRIIARMNNVFNTKYITQAFDGGIGNPGIAQGAAVFFGTGRTFSVSSIINF